MLQGFFREKAIIPRKSDATNIINVIPNPRKVIMLLVDALREDFVDFDEEMAEFKFITDLEATYKGKKMEVMR